MAKDGGGEQQLKFAICVRQVKNHFYIFKKKNKSHNKWIENASSIDAI